MSFNSYYRIIAINEMINTERFLFKSIGYTCLAIAQFVNTFFILYLWLETSVSDFDEKVCLVNYCRWLLNLCSMMNVVIWSIFLKKIYVMELGIMLHFLFHTQIRLPLRLMGCVSRVFFSITLMWVVSYLSKWKYFWSYFYNF